MGEEESLQLEALGRNGDGERDCALVWLCGEWTGELCVGGAGGCVISAVNVSMMEASS